MYRDNFFWNFYLRTLLESTLEVSVLSMMDTFVQNLSSWGYVSSYLFSVLILALLAGILLWLRCWLKRQDLSDQQLIDRVGSLLDGLRLKPDSLIIQEWFVLRRCFFTATAFYAVGHTWLALSVIYTSSLITVGLNLRMPFESRLTVKMEIMNEIFLLLIQYHLLALTDLVKLAETRVQAGMSLASFTILNLLVNVIVNVVTIAKGCKLMTKRQYSKVNNLIKTRREKAKKEIKETKRRHIMNLFSLHQQNNMLRKDKDWGIIDHKDLPSADKDPSSIS